MKLFWVILFLTSLNTYSQSAAQSFFELSSPEKWWVFFHPFKAKRALIISHKALKVTDSISKTNQLINDLNGGQLDAFKHSYWMVGLAVKIGMKPALKLGKAHEKGNYKAFKNGKLEDGFMPDKISSDMDLYNNITGAQIANNYGHLTKEDLIELIIEKIKKGKMKVIKKDNRGNFLNCEGDIIPDKILLGIWENDKCLIFSNASIN